MKKLIILSIILFLFQSIYSQSFNEVFSQANVENDAIEQMQVNEQGIVQYSLLDPENKKKLFLPKKKIYYTDFEILGVESISKNQKRVYMQFNLEIQNETCKWVHLGVRKISCDIWYFFKEDQSVTKNWLGETLKVCTNRQLLPNIDEDSITLLHDEIFPHPEIEESLLNDTCDPPKYDSKDIRIDDTFEYIYTFNYDKEKINLLDHIQNNWPNKSVVIITWDQKCMDCLMAITGAEIEITKKYKDDVVLVMINRDEDFDSYISFIGYMADHEKKRFLWSPKSIKDKDSYSQVTNSTMTPDIFMFSKLDMIYYRQGDGNYGLSELADIIEKGIKEIKENTSNYSEIEGLIKIKK